MLYAKAQPRKSYFMHQWVFMWWNRQPRVRIFPFSPFLKASLGVSKILCLLMLRPVVLCSFLELHWLLSRLPFLSIVLRECMLPWQIHWHPFGHFSSFPLNGTIVPETKGPQYTKLQKATLENLTKFPSFLPEAIRFLSTQDVPLFRVTAGCHYLQKQIKSSPYTLKCL